MLSLAACYLLLHALASLLMQCTLCSTTKVTKHQAGPKAACHVDDAVFNCVAHVLIAIGSSRSVYEALFAHSFLFSIRKPNWF